jgi:hypothetical protein
VPPIHSIRLYWMRFMIPTWAVGQAWPRTVLILRTLPPADHESVVAHELVHLRQWEELGTIGFALEYARQVLRYGYHATPLEAEARASAYDPLQLDRARTLLRRWPQ